MTPGIPEPTIRGADVPRREAYKKSANAARDECLIGRSIRGNVAFVNGGKGHNVAYVKRAVARFARHHGCKTVRVL